MQRISRTPDLAPPSRYRYTMSRNALCGWCRAGDCGTRQHLRLGFNPKLHFYWGSHNPKQRALGADSTRRTVLEV